MNQIQYLGYGPTESYADKHHGTTLGLFSSTVDALHVDYLKPQENGSHWGCHKLAVSGDTTCNLAFEVQSEKSFSFAASRYTQEELTAKAHNYELEPSGCTVLCLDFAQSGLGSSSCGPVLASRYQADGPAFGGGFFWGFFNLSIS